MAYVRGHYRKNGSYVRPHTRRTRPGTGSAAPRPAAPRPAGVTTNVRGHYRNGSYVRPHRRRLGGPAAVAAGGGGLLLLIVVLIALFGGGGEAPAGTSPSPAVSTAEASR